MEKYHPPAPEPPRRRKLKETLMREASIGPVDSSLSKRAEWMIDNSGIREFLGSKIIFKDRRTGEVEKGVSVLCVGAGKGHEMDEIDAVLPGSEVRGVDPHDHLTRPVKRRLETLAHDARYLPETASAENLEGVPDGSVDGVAYFFVLHHIDEAKHAKALEEAGRVLKQDGYLFVAEDLVDGAEEHATVERIDRRLNFEFGDDHPHNYRNADEWRNFFRSNGFEMVRVNEIKPGKVRHGFMVFKKIKPAERAGESH